MNTLKRLTLFATMLAVAGAVWATDPSDMDDLTARVQQIAGDELILDISRDGGGRGSIWNVDLASGEELYLDGASLELIHQERDRIDAEDRQIIATLTEQNGLSLAVVYRRVMDELAGTPGMVSLDSMELEGLDYEVEFGRLVVDIELREDRLSRGGVSRTPVSDGGRWDDDWDDWDRLELSIYADPFSGQILTMEWDD